MSARHPSTDNPINRNYTELLTAGLLHQYTVGFDADKILLYISLAFAVIHLGVYGRKLGRTDAID